MKRLLLVLALVAFLAGTAWSKSPYLSAFNSRYGTARTKLDDCATCHDTSNMPNRNVYGRAFGRARSANGSNSDAGLQAIEPDDTDGDGATNILEITALTWPGDPGDVPSLPVQGETWTHIKALYR
jgi:hypothetical protein